TRRDPITGEQHAPVSDSIEYTRVTTLWQRRIGNGTLTCDLYRGTKPSKRLVMLIAVYDDGNAGVTRSVRCESPEEETKEAARLEAIIRAASRRPDESPEQAPAAPGRGSP
ncbi:MAG TPA: hypothetical protein VGF15_03475, partial [Solirubrobacteraceae bacterium]